MTPLLQRAVNPETPSAQGLSPAVYQRLMGMAKQKRVQLILLRFQPRRQQGGLDPVGMAVADQHPAVP